MKKETVTTPVLNCPVTAEQLQQGYFQFVGKLAGNWKQVQYVNPSGNVEETSSSTMKHEALFSYVKEWKCGRIKAPVIVIDKTFVYPEYYKILGAHKAFYFEKIVN